MGNTDTTSADPSGNYLLGTLAREEFALLAPGLTLSHFAAGAVLHAAREPLAEVYFPLTGVASVTTLMVDGGLAEVGEVGREGMTGLSAFLGAETTPLQTIVQVHGVFARLPRAALHAAVRPGTALRALLLGYASAYLIVTAQTSGCNLLHTTLQRCTRWLLRTGDHFGGDSFPLSHQFLAYMISAPRSGVTAAMGTLRERGLIDYRRGIVAIRDRPGLEAACCECYAVVRATWPPEPGGVMSDFD